MNTAADHNTAAVESNLVTENETIQTNLKSALEYLPKGWPIFPVVPKSEDNKPHVLWGTYQDNQPTEAEVKAWWGKWPNANIGLPLIFRSS